LAEVFSKPIAAVSLLEAIAVAGGQRGKVIAVLDAGRGDVYAGEYQVEGSEVQLERERLLTRSELMQTAVGSVVVTADHSLAQAARDGSLQVEEIEVPGSDAIARLGWRKILAGNTLSPAELDANYIRRSSELFSKGSS
jgi:tRNA A37 threonylcarbamoyladenosine modification protein TsaB